jgi:DnaJ-class molecular chaperone
VNSRTATQVLDVSINSPFSEIKYAYRKLSLQYHPDKNTKEKDGEKFKKITDAYHYLKKQNKRSNSSFNPKKHSDKQDEEKYSPRKPRYKKNKSPEEDWSRFTKDFESNEDWWNRYQENFWEEYENNLNSQHSKSSNEGTRKNDIDLSVMVDPSLCIACCSCENIAPNVFTIDKLSTTNPKSRVYDEHGASNKKIINAAETCPTKAILVNGKKDGKRIFPY